MSVRATNAVWEYARAGAVQKLILLALADHVNAEGLCWPSIARVGQMAGVGRATVFRALNDLEQMGYLQRVERGGGSGRSNVYVVMPGAVDNPPEGSHSETVKGLTVRRGGLTPGTAKGLTGETLNHKNRKEPCAEFVSRIPEDFDPDFATRVAEAKAKLSAPRRKGPE